MCRISVDYCTRFTVVVIFDFGWYEKWSECFLKRICRIFTNFYICTPAISFYTSVVQQYIYVLYRCSSLYLQRKCFFITPPHPTGKCTHYRSCKHQRCYQVSLTSQTTYSDIVTEADKLIVNEILTFVCDKTNTLPYDMLVKLLTTSLWKIRYYIFARAPAFQWRYYFIDVNS